MWDFSFSKSMGLMRQTAPFLLFRMAVYFIVAVSIVLITGTGAGIGYGVGFMGDADFQGTTTFWGGGIGLALTLGIIFFLREYTLYMVKAGHIAVMIEALDGRELPQNQVAYAQTIVKNHFGKASILFGIDQLVKGVINAITGLLQGLMSLLPVPGLDRIMGVVRAYLKVAVGLLDEVVLAHILRTNAENPWHGAREALVLYGQNAKPMMINAAWVTLFVYLLSFLVFLVMLAPAGLVVYLMPGAWSAGGIVFAILFAWAVKAALIEPFAIACLLQAFFKVTDGQVPNPEWEERLEGASKKFKELGNKAAGWAGMGPKAPQPEPTKPA
ncbi:hypothetical protein ATL17_3293 [Maritalea mobilis]|uniref:Uncharacterized protein n=1 Tax=Maritalea mobilis TaxID=483324 RepID=A0A4R6VGJ6_9HYPH|nr:hypothetical protein [Maritalea mobilis]TDQ60406.1 hypothetical protein ATL17_3293 [Maritalea mobilis]